MMADYSKGYTVAEDQALDELKEVIVKRAKVRQQILKSKKEMENCKLVVKYNDEKYFEKKLCGLCKIFHTQKLRGRILTRMVEN